LSKSVVLKIYKNGKVFAVKQLEKDKILFGSSQAEVDVFLDGDASAVHAAIESDGSGFVVKDLNSQVGTYKNGDKILEASLKDGDSVTMGEFTVDVSFAQAETGVPAENESPAETQKPVETQKPEETVQATEITPGFGSKPENEAPKAAVEVTPEVAPLKKSAGAQGVGVSGAGGGLSVAAADAGMAHRNKYGRNTYAPASKYKNVNEFIRPTKGTLVETLVCWGERVISAYHFSERGTLNVGTHPSCDILVPLISTNVNKVPLIQLDSAAVIIIHPGLEGTLVSDSEAIPFSELQRRGRLSGNMVTLQQGEMARINLGGEVELVVRYASQAPKPLLIPFIDLSSNGFLAVLLAVLIAGILSLFVALSAPDELDEDKDDEKYRTALIITNPPKPPPRVKRPPPKKAPPKKVKKQIVKVKPKKVKPKKVKMDMSKKSKNKDKGGASGARGIKKDATAKALVKTKSKAKNKAGSVKKGGAVKTTKKKAAQAQSERKVEKAGLFGVFGNKGRNNRLDTEYQGKGELAGLADEATGAAGFNEDRPGDGLGSKLKETGGGKGRSNVGVTGIKGSGKGLGNGSGFGNRGLGDRKGVSIVPGGGGEEYSGTIDKDGIRKVFFDNSRAIRSCYERQLNRSPNLGGKLMLDFDIGEHGRVVGRPSIKWGGSTMKDKEVANCILLRLKAWRFPEPPRNQVVNVIYPLAFSAK